MLIGMRQPAPLRDGGIELLIQTYAPGTRSAPISTRDERHITIDELDGLRGGLERYQLNRDAVIGGQSYEFSALYWEHREWKAQIKIVNDLFNQYVWQTADLRQDPKLMRETLAVINVVQALIRNRDDRAAKFETALYARRLAEAEYEESRKRNDFLAAPVEAESRSEMGALDVGTSDMEDWLQRASLLWEEDTQIFTKVYEAFCAVRNGHYPNIREAMSDELHI
ncbi:hypothetical protein EAF04_001008 [Stromatinia cepivora]|nr:hypothetical protein EAF04_001008 [Stromatinia cepivora]